MIDLTNLKKEIAEIQYVIGYLEGVAEASSPEIYHALKKPIAMLKNLIDAERLACDD